MAPIDPTKCSIVQGRDGWYICDRSDDFGDGPYTSYQDARNVLNEWERDDAEAKTQELDSAFFGLLKTMARDL